MTTNAIHKIRAGLATAVALTLFAGAPTGASAACDGGGMSAADVDICTPTPKARLLPNGALVPPKAAPPRIKRAIAFANRIRNKPYIFGGGHQRWWDEGYDCSGAVSYALRGGRFLGSPVPSGSLMRWGAAGKGRWVTVYAHGGHTYAVIAGFRWDTSGNTDGSTGPSWHAEARSPNRGGFVARHPDGY